MDIDDKMLGRFVKLISDRIGLCIRKEDIEAFRRTLLSCMKGSGFGEPGDFLNFLASDTEGGNKQWKALIIAVTTGESYFFRDRGHFSLLQNTILPELIRRKYAERSIRIWSAGCSTGEEPYSIAIVLDMLLPDPVSWDIYIVGTDINDEALAKARGGIFSQWSLRSVDKAIQDRYFKKTRQDGWELNDGIRKMVEFRYGNLIGDGLAFKDPALCNMDVIICRNVFIYFSKEAVAQVIARFGDALNDGGYLISGHGELYEQQLPVMRQLAFPEAVILKKCAKEAAQPVHRRTHLSIIKRQEPGEASKPTVPRPEPQPHEPVDPIPEIEALIKAGRYAEAIDMADRQPDPVRDSSVMLCLMAQAYANSGAYGKAEAACRKAIENSPEAAEPYFMLAHLAEAGGDGEEAKGLLKKALYLDPGFIAAYCELGWLYAKQNDVQRARRARAAALELIKRLPCGARVKPYEITAGELLGYLERLAGQADEDLTPAGQAERNRR